MDDKKFNRILNILKRELSEDGVVPTRLYCRNLDVDAENQRCLADLEGEAYVYTAKPIQHFTQHVPYWFEPSQFY